MRFGRRPVGVKEDAGEQGESGQAEGGGANAQAGDQKKPAKDFDRDGAKSGQLGKRKACRLNVADRAGKAGDFGEARGQEQGRQKKAAGEIKGVGGGRG